MSVICHCTPMGSWTPWAHGPMGPCAHDHMSPLGIMGPNGLMSAWFAHGYIVTWVHETHGDHGSMGTCAHDTLVQ